MSWIKDVKSELAQLDYGANSLKKFAWMVGGVLLVLAGLFYYKEWAGWIFYFLALTGVLLWFLAFLAPQRLRLIYKIWMGLAFVLGWLMSRVLLTLIFYVVLAPLGMAAKLFGKQFLALKTDPGSKSYWIQKEKTDSDYEKMY